MIPTLQKRSRRIRSGITCGWLARRPQIEIVLVDTVADSLDVLLFLHNFVLVVVLTDNEKPSNQKQGEWIA
jgi:hypothetical protein